jgi:hypothetical protein
MAPKTLPNGNKVADGKLMGWVYKLKNIETEQPLKLFPGHWDVDRQKRVPVRFNST